MKRSRLSTRILAAGALVLIVVGVALFLDARRHERFRDSLPSDQLPSASASAGRAR